MPTEDKKAISVCENLLTRMGVAREVKPEKFWRRLEKRFGKPALDVMERISQRGEGLANSEFWRVKNENLDLSLWLSGQFMGDFYRSYLRWFSAAAGKQDLARVLDVGCDNGILTCCYAATFPHAEIIGIDDCEQGISGAKELAGRLGISNVTFRVLNAEEFPRVQDLGNFDLITATMTYHSVSELPGMPLDWSLLELELPDSAKWQKLLAEMASLLQLGGRFVSVEKLTSSVGVLWWARALNAAGLHVDWPASQLLCYDGIEEAFRWPALICDRQQHGSAALGLEVLAFCATPELTQLAKGAFEADVAEALFEAVRERTLIWGIEVTFEEERMERFEVWEAGPIILAYGYSNKRRRRLVIGARHQRAECVEHGRQYWSKTPHQGYREYLSVVERDRPSR
jgi:SAM-dependent methyltransferase